MSKCIGCFGILLIYFLLADSKATANKSNRVVTAVKRLRPGETPVQTPGWTHCVTDMKVTPAWRRLKSPGYPKLASNQMQCSWILEAPIGWRVMITFKDLYLSPPVGDGPEKSCQTSYVNIIDMTAQTTQGKFCGKAPPGDFVSLGSVLRIDLQGDKSKTTRRGFLISYTMTKDSPGFRAPRKQLSPSDAAPGKVNFNEFRSNQQKLINNVQRGPPKRKYSIPKKLVYASDTTTAKPTTTTVANEGWIGNVALPKGPVETKRSGGAKVQVRKITSKPASGPSSSGGSNNGNRIRATNQRRPAGSDARSNNNGEQNHDNSALNSYDDYWTGVGNDPAPLPDGQAPRIYGHHNQPHERAPKKQNEDQGMKGNYVVMKEDGVTTEQLIIIIVGVLACIVLLFAVFLVKKFCFDYKKDEKQTESKQNDLKEDPYAVNHDLPLPGTSRKGSLHSVTSFHDMQSLSRHTSLAPTDHHLTSSRKSGTNGQMSRHQSLVAKHEAIYRNHMAMLKHGNANPGLQRRSLHNSRSNINRPLPPVPDEKEKAKPVDIDEDYCSGSDEDADVTTMRREMSEWEIQQQKIEKRKNRHL